MVVVPDVETLMVWMSSHDRRGEGSPHLPWYNNRRDYAVPLIFVFSLTYCKESAAQSQRLVCLPCFSGVLHRGGVLRITPHLHSAYMGAAHFQDVRYLCRWLHLSFFATQHAPFVFSVCSRHINSSVGVVAYTCTSTSNSERTGAASK